MLGQPGLLGDDAIGIDHHPRRVHDLLDVHVDGARHGREIVGDLLRRLIILVRLADRPADLYVDRSRQPEVEDLAHDVGRLGEELQLGKPARQLVTLGVQQFVGQYATDWNSVLAALSMAEIMACTSFFSGFAPAAETPFCIPRRRVRTLRLRRERWVVCRARLEADRVLAMVKNL